MTRECKTQAEVDAAVSAGAEIVIRVGSFFASGKAIVRAYDSSQVRACDSSQVRAYGSSQVTACDSSQVTACDSSQVTACDSSQVTACGSSQVRAYGSSQVRASKFVAVTIHGSALVKGGVQIRIPKLKTAKMWCGFYGVKIAKGIAVLFKAVGNDFHSPKGADYTPGKTPRAADWDGGEKECGGGLHFSPRPFMALKFNGGAKRFVACKVKLSEIAVHPNGNYPDKVKAAGCCGPCVEVDIDGNRIGKTK